MQSKIQTANVRGFKEDELLCVLGGNANDVATKAKSTGDPQKLKICPAST